MKRVLALAVCAIALAACAPPSAGPPPIRPGAKCAACGMNIQDLHFAGERRLAGTWKAYDSIECLIRDAQAAPGGEAYLPDYDASTLHAADSLWVVKGDFPSPMGGGYAAFLDRGAADELAAQRSGTVGRLRDFLAGGTPAP